jgi:ligand-binding SRPBCC domain-containing protein
MMTKSIHVLERETWVPRPLPEVFDFFSRAENLAQITPPWLDFKILTPPPIQMKEGTVIDYLLRIHGLPCRWLTYIECWDPPYGFVDVQRKGPYRLWRHTHRFQEKNNGTLVSDRVEFALPFGPLGELIYRLQVARELERIFDFRAQQIHLRFGD